jgi:hypothetical protein
VQEILEQPGQRIRFRAPIDAFQIQQPYNLSRVSHVPTREQVGETLHVLIRQIGHQHALTWTSLARQSIGQVKFYQRSLRRTLGIEDAGWKWTRFKDFWR